MSRGPEDYGVVGTLTGSTQTAGLTLGFGQSVVAVQLSGTWSGTVVFEAAQDPTAGANAPADSNANWVPVQCIQFPGPFSISSTTANGNFFFLAGGFSRFRARCSAYTSGTITVSLASSTANANFSGVVATTIPAGLSLFTGASPGGASTAAQTAITNLDAFTKALISARLAGGAGGTLDVYLQSSVNNGANWFDVCHFPQLAAGAAAIGYFISLTRGETYNTTTPVQVNAADGTPVLAVNTVVPHGFGNALRVVFVAGAGTTAGTTQTIIALLSTQ